jgi:hypothetical protein
VRTAADRRWALRQPIPFVAVLDELRTIEIGKDEIVMGSTHGRPLRPHHPHDGSASGERSTFAAGTI